MYKDQLQRLLLFLNTYNMLLVFEINFYYFVQSFASGPTIFFTM